jgi:hypothetical protein
LQQPSGCKVLSADMSAGQHRAHRANA